MHFYRLKFAEMEKKVQKCTMYKNNNNESFEFETLCILLSFETSINKLIKCLITKNYMECRELLF